MGNKTFQVFFLIVLAFSSSYAAKHPICLSQTEILQAKSVSELEKMVHPLCLKEKISLVTNTTYTSLNNWEEAYQFLKMAERLPESWVVFNRVLPFFQDRTAEIIAYDKAWALLSNEEYQKIVSKFLEQQEIIRVELKNIPRSQAASRFLKKKMPFL